LSVEFPVCRGRTRGTVKIGDEGEVRGVDLAYSIQKKRALGGKGEGMTIQDDSPERRIEKYGEPGRKLVLLAGRRCVGLGSRGSAVGLSTSGGRSVTEKRLWKRRERNQRTGHEQIPLWTGGSPIKLRFLRKRRYPSFSSEYGVCGETAAKRSV